MWGELIKIALPENTVDCHIFCSFREVSASNPSEAPFCFGSFPLFTDALSTTFSPDGSYSLQLYKYDTISAKPSVYLSRNKSAVKLVMLSDSFSLRTSLVSHRFTQNEVLAKLFAWESIEEDDLEGILAKMK